MEGDFLTAAQLLLSRRPLQTFLCLMLLSWPALQRCHAQEGTKPSTCSLTVRVVGLRNSKGIVGIAVFNNTSGFPEDSTRAFKAKEAEIMGAEVEVVFLDLPPGTYAVSIRHDENRNGKLDKNVFGIPKEGYGASNNPPLTRRAPNFEESKFNLTGPAQTIEIKVHY